MELPTGSALPFRLLQPVDRRKRSNCDSYAKSIKRNRTSSVCFSSPCRCTMCWLMAVSWFGSFITLCVHCTKSNLGDAGLNDVLNIHNECSCTVQLVAIYCCWHLKLMRSHNLPIPFALPLGSAVYITHVRFGRVAGSLPSSSASGTCSSGKISWLTATSSVVCC